MSESKWLAATKPEAMIKLVRRRASDRKLRLAACACCRQIVYLCIDEGRKAVEVAESYADGRAGGGELSAARESLLPYTKAGPEYVPWLLLVNSAYEAALEVAAAVPGYAASAVAISLESSGPGAENYFGTPAQAEAKSRAHCVAAIRCVLGNPYRQEPFSRTWCTGDAVAVAAGIYNEGAFDRMPILADALQDAGCDDDAVLSHCREPGPHSRGCWALDLVLERV